MSNQVTARVKDLKKLGTTLDALVRAGSNQIGGISFDVDEPKPFLDDARKKAVADARAKAELYAACGRCLVGTRRPDFGIGRHHQPAADVRHARQWRPKRNRCRLPPANRRISANVSITYEIQ